MKEYNFPHADAALAFLEIQGLCLFCTHNIVPVNLEGYPTYPGSDSPRTIARLYSDKLNFNVDTQGMKAPALSILKKYQRKLKRALKKEGIPSINI